MPTDLPAAPHGLLVPNVDLPAFLGVSRAGAYRLRARSDFPKPMALEGVGVVFLRAELEKWASGLKHARGPRKCNAPGRKKAAAKG
jgi:predicted DNA-binding transcriptional regulator AlpA